MSTFNTMPLVNPRTSGFGTAPITIQSSSTAFGKPAAKTSEDARLIRGAASDVSKQHVSALPRLRNDTLVSVIVGEEQASFYVYRNVICESSSFFKAALNGAFKEGVECKVTLPEDDPDVFEQFLQWIYTKAYNISPITDTSPKNLCKQSWQYVRLYVFAEKTQVNSLKDHILEQLYALRQRFGKVQAVTYECVEFAYDHTPPDSALRKLLVAMFVWTDVKIDAKAITAIPEFAAEVASGMQQRIHSPSLVDPFTVSINIILFGINYTQKPLIWGPSFGGFGGF